MTYEEIIADIALEKGRISQERLSVMRECENMVRDIDRTIKWYHRLALNHDEKSVDEHGA